MNTLLNTYNISKKIDIEHRTIRRTIEIYKNGFKRLGEIKEIETKNSLNKILKAYEINRVQYFYLITLLKNTEKTVTLKCDIVQALDTLSLLLPKNF